MPSAYQHSPDHDGATEESRWVPWALWIILISVVGLFVGFVGATHTSDRALEETLAKAFIYGSLVLWPSFLIACFAAIAVRVWRRLRSAR
jgi:uncharacterized membrane protein